MPNSLSYAVPSRWIMRLVLSLILLSALPFANGDELEDAKLPTISQIIELPIQQIRAVESSEGLVFVGDNGRFVFKGELIDTWNKVPLRKMSEVSYAATHINLDTMGLDITELNTITFGTGNKRIVAFVDPLCPHCKSWLETAMSKQKEFTFHLIVVPVLGDESNRLAKLLYCAQSKEKRFDAFRGGSINDLSQDKKCNLKNYDKTLTVAQLFNIKEIPFFIAPDGRYKSGAGATFWQWAAKDKP
jgi:thiol:disulfide interchange protein DsbC